MVYTKVIINLKLITLLTGSNNDFLQLRPIRYINMKRFASHAKILINITKVRS